MALPKLVEGSYAGEEASVCDALQPSSAALHFSWAAKEGEIGDSDLDGDSQPDIYHANLLAMLEEVRPCQPCLVAPSDNL
jgi:hypothetical protein